MRLPVTAHTALPWRIHDVAPDFEVEDVWALPTPGGPGELSRLIAAFVSDDAEEFPKGASLPVRLLWAIRFKAGALLGWDDDSAGVGSRVDSLRDRLPQDLHDASTGPDFADVPFTSVYLLENEWASEMANRTVHTVMHIGWVPDESGGYRGQMAVLVKANGRFGRAYMAAIKPFRHLIVYPALMRSIGRSWRATAPTRP
jgi:hypothetical protein